LQPIRIDRTGLGGFLWIQQGLAKSTLGFAYLRSAFMEAHLLQHRIIFLGTAVTAETANSVIQQLLLLDAEDQQRPIDLYLNSPGGSTVDALAIIDAMQCVRAPVSTVCIGMAASAAAWLLAAGSRGRRYATPHAEVMIHQVQAKTEGPLMDLEIAIERLRRIESRMNGLLAGWTGQPEERIKEDTERDFFMTAEEARDYGIIDEILPLGASRRAGL